MVFHLFQPHLSLDSHQTCQKFLPNLFSYFPSFFLLFFCLFHSIQIRFSCQDGIELYLWILGLMGLCFWVRILGFSLDKVAVFDELKREESCERKLQRSKAFFESDGWNFQNISFRPLNFYIISFRPKTPAFESFFPLLSFNPLLHAQMCLLSKLFLGYRT